LESRLYFLFIVAVFAVAVAADSNEVDHFTRPADGRVGSSGRRIIGQAATPDRTPVRPGVRLGTSAGYVDRRTDGKAADKTFSGPVVRHD